MSRRVPLRSRVLINDQQVSMVRSGTDIVRWNDRVSHLPDRPDARQLARYQQRQIAHVFGLNLTIDWLE